jgi:hypothetical protein
VSWEFLLECVPEPLLFYVVGLFNLNEINQRDISNKIKCS